jgi:SP family facilitated glucose transporter-like MFS transporter 8
LRGKSYDPRHEVDELKRDLEESAKNQVSLKEVLGKKATIRALIIGFGLMFFQQMSGINVVIFFATDIFKVR